MDMVCWTRCLDVAAVATRANRSVVVKNLVDVPTIAAATTVVTTVAAAMAAVVTTAAKPAVAVPASAAAKRSEAVS